MTKIERYSIWRDKPSRSQVGDYRFSRLDAQENLILENGPDDPEVMVVTSRSTEAQHKRRFWDYFWPKSSCAVKFINSEEGNPASPLLAVPLSDSRAPAEIPNASRVNVGQVVSRRESLPPDWRNKYSQTQWRDDSERNHRAYWEVTTHIGDAPSTRGYSTSGIDRRLEDFLTRKHGDIDFRPGDGINVRTGEYYRFGRKVEQPDMLISTLRTMKSWGSAWLNRWLHGGSDLTASSDSTPVLAEKEQVSADAVAPSNPVEQVTTEEEDGLYVLEYDSDYSLDTLGVPTDYESSGDEMKEHCVEPA